MNILMILCAVVGITIIIERSVAYKRSALLAREDDAIYRTGYKGTFSGRYVHHWEVGRFEWMNGPCTLGWGSRNNFCRLVVDDDVLRAAGFYESQGAAGRRAGPVQQMAFVGEIEQVGHFGHRGFCRYRVRVISGLTIT